MIPITLKSSESSLFPDLNQGFALEDFSVFEELAVTQHSLEQDYTILRHAELLGQSLTSLEGTLSDVGIDFLNFSLESESEEGSTKPGIAKVVWATIRNIFTKIVNWVKNGFDRLAAVFKKFFRAVVATKNVLLNLNLPDATELTYEAPSSVGDDLSALKEVRNFLADEAVKLLTGVPEVAVAKRFNVGSTQISITIEVNGMLSIDTTPIEKPSNKTIKLTVKDAKEEMTRIAKWLNEVDQEQVGLKKKARDVSRYTKKVEGEDLSDKERDTIAGQAKDINVAFIAVTKLHGIYVKTCHEHSKAIVAAAKRAKGGDASSNEDASLESIGGVVSRAAKALWRFYTNNWTQRIIDAIQTTTQGFDAVHTEYDRIFDSLPDHEGDIIIETYPIEGGKLIEFLNTVKGAADKGKYKKTLQNVTLDIGNKTYSFNEKGKLEVNENDAKPKSQKFTAKDVDVIRRDLYAASKYRWETAIVRDFYGVKMKLENVQTNVGFDDSWAWGDVAETTHAIAKAYLAETKRVVKLLKAQT